MDPATGPEVAVIVLARGQLMLARGSGTLRRRLLHDRQLIIYVMIRFGKDGIL